MIEDGYVLMAVVYALNIDNAVVGPSLRGAFLEETQRLEQKRS